MRRDVFSYIDQPLDQASQIFIVGGYRMYQPWVGVFAKQDSYSAFMSGATTNRFGYAVGNPILWVDSRGHMPMPISAERREVQFSLADQEEPGMFELLSLTSIPLGGVKENSEPKAFVESDGVWEPVTGPKVDSADLYIEKQQLLRVGQKISYQSGYKVMLNGAIEARVIEYKGIVAEDVWVTPQTYAVVVEGKKPLANMFFQTNKFSLSASNKNFAKVSLKVNNMREDCIKYLIQSEDTVFNISPVSVLA